MSMSRKHYREVVTILRSVAMRESTRRLLAELLADMFQRDNSRFDRNLFMYEVMQDVDAR